jgi:mannose-6-phosphate isomerase-like protein (cupin superfamily)
MGMKISSKINNLYQVIKSANLDETVGIRIGYLTGSDAFSFYGAEIAPFKKVGAHFHESGIEIYQIVQGQGTMHTGIPDENLEVAWQDSFAVQQGDCFTIEEGEVHQLDNDNDHPLLLVVGCPESHLSTNRTVVTGYP